MSFIYEDKELLKLFEKVGQVQQSVEINPEQLRSTALKAISNLRQMYFPVKAEGNAQIFQKNIFNLNSLLLWLVQNKVKVDGHRVAYASAPPAQQGSPATQRGVEPGQSGEPVDQADQQIQYIGEPGEPRVWKEGFIEFLKTLRKQASDSSNIYFQELVSKIIEDANTHKLFDAGLEANEPAPVSEEKKEQSQQTSQQQPKPTIDFGQQVGGGNPQQVAYVQSLEESLKQGGSEDLILPFDLTTDAINLTRFNQFANQLYSLMSNPSFRQEMAEYFGVLGTTLGAINGGIQNFRTNASGTPVAEGGFTLSTNDNADDFANLVGDFAKARNLLTILSPLVLGLSNSINTLRASPTLRNMIGDDILRQQVQRGRDYVNRINGFITYINVKAGRTK